MKVYTKGVKRHRKWLKHLWGEGKRIVYTQSPYEHAKTKRMVQAYIERRVHPLDLRMVRLVPGRMAQQVWRLRRDQ